MTEPQPGGGQRAVLLFLGTQFRSSYSHNVSIVILSHIIIHLVKHHKCDSEIRMLNNGRSNKFASNATNVQPNHLPNFQ